jgi:hypothetical protein
MKLARILPVIFVLSPLAACDGEPTVVEGTLEISCPLLVVCDENFDYRAYHYRNERVSVYLSFDPSVVSNRSLESYQSALDYIDLRIYFPDQGYDDGDREAKSVYMEKLVRSDAFAGFEGFVDDRLTWSMEGRMDELIEMRYSRDPDCSSDDMGGVCWEYSDVDIAYDIQFDLIVPPS